MHIGSKIKQVLDSQSKDRTVKWFAEQLNCDRRNVYHIFSRSTVDTELLLRISRILDYNFFLDLANDYSDRDENNDTENPESSTNKS